MADYVPTYLGSVMKAIACTPNKNFDEAAYDRGVIQPARRIRKLQDQLEDQRPSDDEIKEVMTLLLTILDTKMVDMEEREDRIREILDRNQLHGLLPDLLPLGATLKQQIAQVGWKPAAAVETEEGGHEEAPTDQQEQTASENTESADSIDSTEP